MSDLRTVESKLRSEWLQNGTHVQTSAQTKLRNGAAAVGTNGSLSHGDGLPPSSGSEHSAVPSAQSPGPGSDRSASRRGSHASRFRSRVAEATFLT